MLDIESNELDKLSQDDDIRRFKKMLDSATIDYKKFEWISEEEEKLYMQNTYKNIGIKEGIKKGLKEGSQKKQKELILSMYEAGISMEKIQKITNLSMKEIKAILEK